MPRGMAHAAGRGSAVAGRVAGGLAAVAVVATAAAGLAGCGSLSGNGGGPGGGGESRMPSGGGVYEIPVSVSQPQVAPDTGDHLIDASHVGDGYAIARCHNDARLKFQVSCGDMAYNYDLPGDGSPLCVPLNMGNGSYVFRIMLNTSGNNYVEYARETADVMLSSEFAPFLLPNEFCDYDGESECSRKAVELAAGAETSCEALESVCTFVADNVEYDRAKAAELAKTTGYVPDPDETLRSGKGVCFDYSSLSAAMLRRLGIPTKVVTGYVGEGEELYHAWIMVYVDGRWQTAVFDVRENTWSRCDVTLASTGGGATVGDGSVYTDRYVY